MIENQQKTVHVDHNCVFCKIIAGHIPSQIIMQTEHALVVQDIAPQAPIHYLLIPKQHIQDVTSFSQEHADVIIDMMLLPKKIALENPNAMSFKLITNNGYAAGQRVFHLHFHFMAGKNFQ